jgi:hypothetical protein
VTIDLTGVDEVTIPVIRSKPNITSLSGNDP